MNKKLWNAIGIALGITSVTLLFCGYDGQWLSGYFAGIFMVEWVLKWMDNDKKKEARND